MPRHVPRVGVVPHGAAPDVLRQGESALRAQMRIEPAFPSAVEQEAAAAAKSPRLPDLDRTDIPFVTIDPEGARDLDQALHLERRGDGYVVHYAIADVAAFVAPGGAVDQEANRRGETLYGIGDKVPLHPVSLSEGACSLLPDGARPALLWTVGLDASGERWTSASSCRSSPGTPRSRWSPGWPRRT